ncbi:MAG: GEVED domain-containing protein [Chloroflexi bacterium]|nr:GEVED domain-containing protein [Chloroflexota bacterium]
MARFLVLYLLTAILLSACEPPKIQHTPTPTIEELLPVAEFGDAPDPGFPSLLASDGLRTLDITQFWLGAGATLEEDANITDRDQADDGLIKLIEVKPGLVSVTFQVTKSEQAQASVVIFNLWADTNNDGRWQDFTGPSNTPITEWIVENQGITLAPGETAQIEAEFPQVGGALEHWMRASITDVPVSGTEPYITGQYQFGEVEDYHVLPPYAWGIECDPRRLEILHGTAGRIDVDDPSGTGTTLEVKNVTGPIGVDPDAADIDVDPSTSDGPIGINFGVIVTSKRVHSIVGGDFSVEYSIDLTVKGSLGTKTLTCEVVVRHPGVKIIAGGGYTISYGGPLEVKTGTPFEVTFQVTDSAGNPAPEGTAFAASFGNTPSDPLATHANGELDAQGQITLTLDENWPAGNTEILWLSLSGNVYKVADVVVVE